jgi:hypothetical protein
MQMKGDVPVNDEVGLEREADEMGERAMSGGTDQSGTIETLSLARTQPRNPPPSAEGKLIQKWGGETISGCVRTTRMMRITPPHHNRNRRIRCRTMRRSIIA